MGRFVRLLLTYIFLIVSNAAFCEKITVNNIYYEITSSSTVSVSNRGEEEDDWMYYQASELYTGSLIIPESISYNETTYTVAAIANDAFIGSKLLTSIFIPSTIQTIGNGAFTGCSGLETISVSEANKVFESSNGILYKKNPSSIFFVPKNIANDITIKEDITVIPSSAFQNCKRVTTITIPDNVTTIEDGAFADCTNLEEIFFGKSVKTIGVNAFKACNSLYIVTIPSSVTSIASSAFSNCQNLQYVLLKEGLQSIGSYAFYNCQNIIGIELPSTLKSIGDNAFKECINLSIIRNNSNLQLEKGSESNGCVALYAEEIQTGQTTQPIISDFLLEIDKYNCGEVQARFDINNNIEYDSLRWNFGDGKIGPNAPRTSYVYEKPGTFSPSLTVWKDGISCVVTKENAVVVREAPNANFYFENTEVIVPRQIDFILEEKSESAISYSWSIENAYSPIVESSEKEFSFYIEERGAYLITLTVESENGCSSTHYEEIYAQEPGEFEYITSSCAGHPDTEQTTVNYRFEGDNLILYGQIITNCGAFNTAKIIDEGDIIRIQTFQSAIAVADCECIYNYEIPISNFNRDSCIIVFLGRTLHINRNQTSITTTDNTSVKIWQSSITHEAFIDITDNIINNYHYELYNSQGQLIEKRHIFSTTTEITLPKQKDFYFIKIYKNKTDIISATIFRN
ncbi:MAG: leucine-rich repeat protein [Bacteroidales bacterium]|nr:leucine-rich repeat protein [Bacteroidales bacterium]